MRWSLSSPQGSGSRVAEPAAFDEEVKRSIILSRLQDVMA
jgi:hypothetical protein